MSRSTTSILVLALAGLLLLATTVSSRADDHRWRALAEEECRPSGSLRPSESHSCEDCCQAGESYETYACSPPVAGSSGRTSAIMTLNDFDEGGDGGDPSECDGEYHDNSELVVALSTGWYGGGARCNRNIRIYANGTSVLAEVVDECDSRNGCDREHAYQPPCRYNVVDASQAVWDKLGITGDEVGEYDITWSDA